MARSDVRSPAGPAFGATGDSSASVVTSPAGALASRLEELTHEGLTKVEAFERRVKETRAADAEQAIAAESAALREWLGRAEAGLAEATREPMGSGGARLGATLRQLREVRDVVERMARIDGRAIPGGISDLSHGRMRVVRRASAE